MAHETEAQLNVPAGESRQAEAQRAYRMVNESIDALQERFGPQTATELLCECGDAACSRRALVPHAAYEAVRSHPRRFVFAPDHRLADGEWVIERRAGYLVVELGAMPVELGSAVDP